MVVRLVLVIPSPTIGVTRRGQGACLVVSRRDLRVRPWLVGCLPLAVISPALRRAARRQRASVALARVHLPRSDSCLGGGWCLDGPNQTARCENEKDPNDPWMRARLPDYLPPPSGGACHSCSKQDTGRCIPERKRGPGGPLLMMLGAVIDLEVHVPAGHTAAAWHGRSLLRLVGDDCLGRQEQRADRGGVLQSGARDLGRVDDA